MHKAAGEIGRAAALVLGENGTLYEAVEQPLLVVKVVRGDFIARRELRPFDDFTTFSVIDRHHLHPRDL